MIKRAKHFSLRDADFRFIQFMDDPFEDFRIFFRILIHLKNFREDILKKHDTGFFSLVFIIFPVGWPIDEIRHRIREICF